MNLYEINKAIEDAIENNTDPETGEASESLFYQLDALEHEYKTKVDNVASYIKNQKALVTSMNDEIKRLQERKRVAENQIDSLERYLISALETRGYKKYETARNKISYSNSKSVKVIDITSLPEEYIKTKVELNPNKDKIKKAILEGIDVPGAYLQENQNLHVK